MTDANDAQHKPGLLVVITGPSGVGKSTITRRVLQASGAAFSVSATTRPRRTGETDGVDYFFVTPDAFREMIQRDELLEWAEVFGNFYGTPAEPVRRQLEAGQTVICEIDVQGGLQVAKRCPDATFILIAPPSEQELARRLAGRGTDSQDVIQRRLSKATAELDTARASGVYNYEIINEDLDQAVQDVLSVLRKERLSS